MGLSSSVSGFMTQASGFMTRNVVLVPHADRIARSRHERASEPEVLTEHFLLPTVLLECDWVSLLCDRASSGVKAGHHRSCHSSLLTPEHITFRFSGGSTSELPSNLPSRSASYLASFLACLQRAGASPRIGAR